MGVTALRRRADTSAQEKPRLAIRARRPRLDVTGLLLVVAAVIVSVTINARNGTDVLVVARPLAVGHVIEAADLRTAQLTTTGPGITLIPASDMASVLGRLVAVPLAPGAPLVRGDLGRSNTLPQGQAVVSVPIGVKQLIANLAAGDHVLVIDTGTAAGLGVSSSGPAVGISVPATVVEVRQPSSDLGDTTAVVTLQLDRSAVQDVASAAAAGHVSLALVPADGS